MIPVGSSSASNRPEWLGPDCLREGRYILGPKLGQGGMGEVFQAWDPVLCRVVALKRLSLVGTEGVVRFIKEAQLQARVRHPNICPILDVQSEGDKPVLAMDLVRGPSLELAAKDLSLNEAVRLMAQVADAVEAAHGQGLIHRDLKPGNILLEPREGGWWPFVCDFGLARDLLEPSPFRSKVVTGTPAFMAPEQLRGERSLMGPATDVFGLGATLYFVLLGQAPFAGNSFEECLLNLSEGKLIRPRNLDPELPRDLENILLRALELRPEDRYQTAASLANDLRNFIRGEPIPSMNLPVSTPVKSPIGGKNDGHYWIKKILMLLLSGAFAIYFGFHLWSSEWIRPIQKPVLPSFQRIGFTPGTIESARFGSNGETIFFSQRVGGLGPEIFVYHQEDPAPKSLGIRDALLLDVSSRDELAVVLRPRVSYGNRMTGVLAKASGDGSGVHEIRENVQEALWDGEGIATLVLDEGLKYFLEFPAGKKALEVPGDIQVLRQVRMTRDRLRIAMLRGSTSTGTQILTFNRNGESRILFTQNEDRWANAITGLAWGPNEEIWISELQGDQTLLWSLTLDGKKHFLWRGPGTFQLMDVSPAGKALVVQNQNSRGATGKRIGNSDVHDLSIHGGTQAQAISADGKSVLLLESPTTDAGTNRDEAFLRPIEGGPPIRLGRGLPQTLSPDGRWVQLWTAGLSASEMDPSWVSAFQDAGCSAKDIDNTSIRSSYLLFIPTGMGPPLVFRLPPGIDCPGMGFPIQHGRALVVNARLNGKQHWVLLNRENDGSTVLTDEGLSQQFLGLQPLSQDESKMLVSGNGEDWFIQQLEGGKPQRIRGLLPGERVIGWCSSNRDIYLRSKPGTSITITRLQVSSGRRVSLDSFSPQDAAGFLPIRQVIASPDGSSIVFTYQKKLSELYLVNGLK